MSTLTTWGLDPFFSDQLDDAAGTESDLARVIAEHRGQYEVQTATQTCAAQLAGRLLGEATEEALPGVGDWVVLRSASTQNETAIVERVLTRRTSFVRGAAGREARAQVIAANVDLVFAVCGLDSDYNIRRIERYLTRIWASGAQPVVVLNKADVCDEAEARVAEVEAHCLGVEVYLCSALMKEGLDALRDLIHAGMTAALVGSSGAGKSTITNALLGSERMATSATSERDGRGRHTTSHRQLVLLPDGGLLLDTPGMRELQLVDEQGLATVFADIEALAQGCRFRDCRHQTEPGCAVKAAVVDGELADERLQHYLKLEHEAQANALRHNEHLRRKSERVWGQLSDEVKLIYRWKRSE